MVNERTEINPAVMLGKQVIRNMRSTVELILRKLGKGMPTLRFLADESCDFAVVRALRSDGHDVFAVGVFMQRSDDPELISSSLTCARNPPRFPPTPPSAT